MRFSDLSKSARTRGFLAATGSLTTRHGRNAKTGAYSTKARRRHLQGTPSLGVAARHRNGPMGYPAVTVQNR